jgi:hypothetical protein
MDPEIPCRHPVRPDRLHCGATGGAMGKGLPSLSQTFDMWAESL